MDLNWRFDADCINLTAILLSVLIGFPACCEGRDSGQQLDPGRLLARPSTAVNTPDISGRWQGDASCQGQTLHVSLDVRQNNDTLTGSLTSIGGDVVSVHHLKGGYLGTSREFVCEDLSVDKVKGDPEFVPQTVKHYELRLSEDRATLVGSALLEGDVTIDLTLARASAVPGQQTEPAARGQARLANMENSGESDPLRGDATNRTHQLCQRARELRAQNKLDESRALLEQAAAFDPNLNSAAVHDNLGLTQLMTGNLDDAISEFNKALSFEPKLQSAQMNIAECYKEEGQIDQAVFYLKEFLNDHPDVPEASAVKAPLRALRALPKKKPAAQSGNDYLESVTAKGLYRWPRERLPIRVYIGSGSGVQGYRDAFRPMIFRSLAQWIQAANSHITWRLVNDPRQADLTFIWTDNMKDFPHGAEQGLTKINCSSPHCIRRAEIKLCTIPLSADGAKSLADGEMELTCLHEIGHALGLQGHSPNNKDVMFFCIHPNPITALTNRDRATIAQLYATDQHEFKNNRRVFGIPGLFGIGF